MIVFLFDYCHFVHRIIQSSLGTFLSFFSTQFLLMPNFLPETIFLLQCVANKIFSRARGSYPLERLVILKKIMDFARGDEVGESLHDIFEYFSNEINDSYFVDYKRTRSQVWMNGERINFIFSCFTDRDGDRFCRVNVHDSTETHTLVGEGKILEWTPAKTRKVLWKGIHLAYKNNRCACCELLDCAEFCGTCKLILNENPCMYCNGIRGRLSNRKRKRKMIHFHKECERKHKRQKY